MNHSLNKTLARLGQKLNRANIFWAVGGSVLLQQYELVKQPKDIDILVAPCDIANACSILDSLGQKIAEREEDDFYATDFFCEYVIDGSKIDLIAGLKIKKNKELLEYKFDWETPRVFFTIESEQIPFSSLSDWLTLYKWMPNKEEKIKLIEEYIKVYQ